MITRSQLARYAQTRGITNHGHAEKDYFQDIMLHAIARHTGTSLVFKGGTALAKCHGLNRFSENLDFTERSTTDRDALMKTIHNELTRYGATHTYEEIEKHQRSTHYRFKIQGILYEGSERSQCSIHIDINPGSTAHTYDPQLLHPPYPDIPSFQLSVLSKQEIAAEKVRAILTRDQPRDIYDLYFLQHQGITPDIETINDKLQYYGMTWEKTRFADALDKKRQAWNTILPQLLHDPFPSFDDVTTHITTHLPG